MDAPPVTQPSAMKQ